MKKVLYLLMIIGLFNPVFVYANNIVESNNDNEQIDEETIVKKEDVILEECVDATTMKVRNSNDEIYKVRLLAIDEVGDEVILDEAKKYVCNALISAEKIIIEYDDKGKEEDSYGRKLVWLFIDDELLQNQIILNGYSKVNSLYDTYKYTTILHDSEISAKNNKVGIWQIKEEIKDTEIVEDNVVNKKNFFQKLFDDILAAIVKILDDILEKLLNLIEDML